MTSMSGRQITRSCPGAAALWCDDVRGVLNRDRPSVRARWPACGRSAVIGQHIGAGGCQHGSVGARALLDHGHAGVEGYITAMGRRTTKYR